MKEINNSDLRIIKGGTISGWVVLGIIAGVIFVSGIIEGITNPDRFNN